MVVPAGGTIIAQGDINPKLYTVLSGWAFRFKMLSDGRRQILNFLLPGDLIGFQGAMFDGAHHGVEALTDIELCALARSKIWELYKGHPELAFDVTWLTAHEESIVDENLLTVGRRTALEGVAMLLMQLYKRMQSLELAEGNRVDLPLSQLHIADALGLSLAHVNKTLRRLQRLGLFRLDGRHLEMINGRALQNLADYFEAPLAPRPLI